MNELVIKGGGCSGGKSYANAYHLFSDWLVKNYDPIPEWEIVMLMWEAWLESYLVMKGIRQLGKPYISNYIIDDELK